ncbi:ATP-dependent DNA helicase [Senna tora]|uniref:ATP-dependent DNA helicase n=1 Tax=Senna tora TaxID=362788 RepID=A0A834T835_9FABA|nr:ATP-dependent DNA helicase [Senna tora]
MVQLMKSGKLLSDLETASCGDKVPVKLEIDDSLEDEHGPLNKCL